MCSSIFLFECKKFELVTKKVSRIIMRKRMEEKLPNNLACKAWFSDKAKNLFRPNGWIANSVRKLFADNTKAKWTRLFLLLVNQKQYGLKWDEIKSTAFEMTMNESTIDTMQDQEFMLLLREQRQSITLLASHKLWYYMHTWIWTVR